MNSRKLIRTRGLIIRRTSSVGNNPCTGCLFNRCYCNSPEYSIYVCNDEISRDHKNFIWKQYE